jgi:hypothetical protein
VVPARPSLHVFMVSPVRGDYRRCQARNSTYRPVQISGISSVNAVWHSPCPQVLSRPEFALGFWIARLGSGSDGSWRGACGIAQRQIPVRMEGEGKLGRCFPSELGMRARAVAPARGSGRLSRLLFGPALGPYSGARAHDPVSHNALAQISEDSAYCPSSRTPGGA